MGHLDLVRLHMYVIGALPQLFPAPHCPAGYGLRLDRPRPEELLSMQAIAA